MTKEQHRKLLQELEAECRERRGMKEKKIVGYISIGQTKCEFDFVCPASTPDDEVEELAKQEAFDFINWGWWEEKE